ncbi:hypothetical protein BDV96DRAFT_654161 [Lophiotrema nucula]|uniref:EF-hand domain-containing protein n=1 Tax=Lophiotrema nucula TaxID=690887 RepID=A0A6A5YJB9_9PLEO|nr:hypothetical protein BDV96DRAFT_654161 [Lophiotrema nucula]
MTSQKPSPIASSVAEINLSSFEKLITDEDSLFVPKPELQKAFLALCRHWDVESEPESDRSDHKLYVGQRLGHNVYACLKKENEGLAMRLYQENKDGDDDGYVSWKDIGTCVKASFPFTHLSSGQSPAIYSAVALLFFLRMGYYHGGLVWYNWQIDVISALELMNTDTEFKDWCNEELESKNTGLEQTNTAGKVKSTEEAQSPSAETFAAVLRELFFMIANQRANTNNPALYEDDRPQIMQPHLQLGMELHRLIRDVREIKWLCRSPPDFSRIPRFDMKGIFSSHRIALGFNDQGKRIYAILFFPGVDGTELVVQYHAFDKNDVHLKFGAIEPRRLRHLNHRTKSFEHFSHSERFEAVTKFYYMVGHAAGFWEDPKITVTEELLAKLNSACWDIKTKSQKVQHETRSAGAKRRRRTRADGIAVDSRVTNRVLTGEAGEQGHDLISLLDNLGSPQPSEAPVLQKRRTR